MSAELVAEFAARSGTNHDAAVQRLQQLLDAIHTAWGPANLAAISKDDARRWSPVLDAAYRLVALAREGR